MDPVESFVDKLERLIKQAESRPRVCYTYISITPSAEVLTRESSSSHDWREDEIHMPHLKVRGKL